MHNSIQQRASFITPGSVALADILANSVAVILILILATLVSRQEQAMDELERNTDIATILSRQLATSVVFNDLPSSPPAILHDYYSCAIPHDCDPSLFPVIEMYDGYIRIFNTNTRIYRAELLRADNAFDRYLSGLTPDMAAAIRMDIHGIREYYIVMGIMEEHSIRPRHWHYLGEQAPPLAGSPLAPSVAGIRDAAEDPDALLNMADGGNQADSFGDRGGAGNSPWDSSQGQSMARDPGLEGTSLGGAEVMNALNYDSLLPPSNNGGSGGGIGLPGGNPSGQPLPPRRRGNSMFDRGTEPGPLAAGGRAMRLYIPNANVSTQGRVLQVQPDDYELVVLSFLFHLLETARHSDSFEMSGQGGLLLELATNTQQAAAALPHYALVQELAAALRGHTFAALPELQDVQEVATLPYNRLLIAPNEMEGDLLVYLNQPAPWLSTLTQTGQGSSASQAAQVLPRFLMRSYPSLFRGEAVEIPPGYMLLMLPDEVRSPQLKWRPVAVIDRELINIGLGFVYAAIEEQQLALHAGVNQLQFNGRPAANPLLREGDGNRILTPAVWILTLLGLLLLLRLVPRRGGQT